MRRAKPERMLDGAPVLFGSSGHFGPVSAQAICIGTVHAVEALKQIQVFEPASIEDDVVGPPDFRNSVDREADALIHRQEEIEQEERNESQINDRSRQHRQETRLAEVGWQPQFQLPVLGQHFCFELSLSLLPAIPKLTLFFVQSGFELSFERSNAVGQVLLDLSHLVTSI